jgi:hypothetical protein
MGTTKGQTNHNKYIGITEIAIRFFYKREYKLSQSQPGIQACYRLPKCSHTMTNK